MAHQLHSENGRTSMMYCGDAPWHGLGVKLQNPASSEQAIAAANLDWDVEKKPLVAMENGLRHPVQDRYAIIRRDWWGQESKPVFGIVGKTYAPLQNRDAFAFFDNIVGQGEAVYHTAEACDG